MVFVEKIKGYAFQDEKTKKLVEQLPKNSIAVLVHQDLDMVAAEMLIERGVKAVINFRTSMTGLFVHNGVETLLKANISVFDIEDTFFRSNLNGQRLMIKDEWLYRDVNGAWQRSCRLKKYTIKEVEQLKNKAKFYFPSQFKAFVGNSLFYGRKELDVFVREVEQIPVLRQFRGKEVLIVARGANFEDDLRIMTNVVKRRGLITVAVDGGADGLLKLGIKPDYIIGDMDSVSERALNCGAQLLVHTYRNGCAPGEGRVKALKLPYKRLVFIGTSEDVAIIFAYCSGAKKLYTVGTRLGMNEFLEKGRVGMGSSLLTRIKVGHALVDLKGVHTLFEVEKKNVTNSVTLLPAIAVLLMFSFSPKFELLVSLMLQWWGGR